MDFIEIIKDLKKDIEASKTLSQLEILFIESQYANNIFHGKIRDYFVSILGWAFFDINALTELANVLGSNKVLSIGAGCAFNESVLKKNFNTNIIASDVNPDGIRYMDVLISSGPESVVLVEPEVLYCSWPSYVPDDDYGKYVRTSECANCNKRHFKLERCKVLPKNYRRMSPRSKKEFQTAHRKRQRENYQANIKYCICCGNKESNPKDFVWESLKVFKGSMFIHVGEGEDGCTGSPRMWCELERGWELLKEKTIDHPNWKGIYSSIQIYKRKTSVLDKIV